VDDNLCFRILVQNIVDPQHIVLAVCQAHSNKISFTLSLAPHVRSDHMVSPLAVPHGKGVHSLFPACIAVEKEDPLMAFFLCIDFLGNQLIAILCLPGQFLSMCSLRPLCGFFPGFLILLLDIVCMYQSIYTFLSDP